MLVDTLKQGLEENGYVVDIALEGKSGLERMINTEYDLLLLDRMLPGMSGDEVCRRLRERKSRVPILMLTARITVGERVTGLDLGADDYLTKPFAFAELLARMRTLLRRPQTPASPRLRVEDLEMDPATHKVYRAGKSIPLSAKEFSLLEYLLRNTGRVLTRNAILNHVWGDEQSRVSNIVEVYINYLRGKIDSGFDPKLIHTVRGVGYSLRRET